MGVHFDLIFLASSTGATQGGLTAGELLAGDGARVVGISVSRREARAREVIARDLEAYGEAMGIRLPDHAERAVRITDRYLAGGYGKSTEEIRETVRTAYLRDGLNLDLVYTGKAFWGMEEYLKEHQIRGKQILFLHTGGTPLFFDHLQELAQERTV